VRDGAGEAFLFTIISWLYILQFILFILMTLLEFIVQCSCIYFSKMQADRELCIIIIRLVLFAYCFRVSGVAFGSLKLTNE